MLTRLTFGLIVAMLLQSAALLAQTRIFYENFDTPSPPNLPTGWVSTLTTQWQTSTSSPSSAYTYTGATPTTVASGNNNLVIVNSSAANTISLISPAISTIGFSDIRVIWGARRTATFTNDVTFEWSIDSVQWNSVNYTQVANNSTWQLVNAGTAIQLPAATANQPKLHLRWTYTQISGTGNYRLDDVIVQGLSQSAAATQLAFVNVPASGTVNTNLPAFTVEARAANNQVVTGFSGNITLSKASGPGNVLGTLVRTAVNGVATFNDIRFDAAGAYTLTASSAPLTPATSSAINIAPLGPTKLAITAITPASPIAGQPFSVTVQAQNASNQPTNVLAATGIVLSATGSTIGGTTTGTIPAGQNTITISGVTLSPAATNVTLTATRTSGDNLTPGTSAPFAVQPAFSPIYEPFVGTGALNANPNWTTHSGTAGQIAFLTTASDAGNSLSYPQLALPQGNRVQIVRGNDEDVHRGFVPATSGVIYYSALVKVVDSVGLAANTNASGDFFLHLGTASGTSVGSFFARLNIRRGTASGTVQLGVANRGATTTTNPTFSTANLAIGQTHFIVVKYDFASGVASLWINPTTNFGGSEPSGAITNNAGTATITQAASIAIRQGTNTGNIEIDEIRVGQTWASVTPAPPPATRLAFASVPATGTATLPLAPIVVQARRADNSLATNFTGNITLERASGPGILGGTLTKAAVNGVATFDNITLSQAGNYTLRAVATGLTSATSSTITILARASQLAFVNVPATGRVGQFLTAFRVQARRPDNTVDTSFTGVITIGLRPNAALPHEVELQTLSGVLSKAAVQGETLFDSVRVNAAGQVTLTASATGLPTANSPVITITSPATRLRFVNAPTSARQNVVIPTFFVDAVHADTVRDTTFTGSVTITLIGTGSLVGNTTRPAVQGRATFDSLRISAAGNFRLVATSGTLMADTTATFGVLRIERDLSVEVPRQFALWQNYPNPFNPSTAIIYDLPTASEVVLKVYDLLGREVATLVSARQAAGRYRVTFNAQNLTTGIYLYRLQAGNFAETRKMMLIK